MTIRLRDLPTLDDRIDAVTAVHNRWRDRLRGLSGVMTTAVAVEDGEVVISVHAALYAAIPSEIDGVRIVRHQAGYRSHTIPDGF